MPSAGITKGSEPMGDKSPKAAKKQASQKQAKSDRADQQKKQQQAPVGMQALPKRK
jgi:hypothetical protein